MQFSKIGQAVFVSHPKNLSELLRPADFVLKKYEVIREVEIDNMEWDNFIDDLESERDFLETAEFQSINVDLIKCVLVYSANISDGILVVADEEGCIRYAAYCKG